MVQKCKDDSSDAYYVRVATVATSVQGRLVHRPSDDAPIGVLSDKQLGADVLHRWSAQRAPPEWSQPDDLQKWGTS